MILKAKSRGDAPQLVRYLLTMGDNEHVRLHDMRGFASNNLHDAFKEAEAVSLGTRCQQYLFSLSLNPPADARPTEADFDRAIEAVEQRLGLEGQPRAIVYHSKEGRDHVHCVWSRIDAETMTAKHMSFYKNKLMAVSRDLYLEHGWKMPAGMLDAAQRNPTNFTLAEWQQAKRQGVDPRLLKQVVQACWTQSDNRKSFASGLEDKGLFLARGDKRGFVVLDHNGEVYSLPKLLDQKTRDVRARLGDGADLSSVDAVKSVIGQRMTPAIRRHIEESKQRFRERSAKLGEYKAEMTRLHRQARSSLEGKQALEWEHETRERAARLPKGLRGLWHRLTGRYQDIRRANEDEAKNTQGRHTQERQALIDKQHDQRTVLQSRFKELRKAQAENLLSLRGDIGRYLKFTREPPPQARQRDVARGLRLER